MFNIILEDNSISMKAKALFIYIYKRNQEGVGLSISLINKATSNGKKSIASGLKELEQAGYLERVKGQDEKGNWKIDYILNFNPNKNVN